jgi:hypothetical protein
MSVAHCGEAYPRAPWTVRWFAVLARDGTSASSNRRGQETANWQRGHVLMWPSPRSQPACSPTVTPIERPLDDRGRGRKRRHAGAARRPKGPEQGPREPDGVPREAQPKPPGPGGTGPRVADEAPAYPSHPPARIPGTDGACRLEILPSHPQRHHAASSSAGPLPAVPMMRSISNTRSLRAFCTELISFLRESHRRRCASCSLVSSSSMRPAWAST